MLLGVGTTTAVITNRLLAVSELNTNILRGSYLFALDGHAVNDDPVLKSGSAGPCTCAM